MQLLRPSTPCSALALPYFAARVPAGFPSPAQDYVEQTLDLNEYCIRHPAATYFVRVQGDSMIDGGIHDGDLLIVDRAIEPKHGDIVIAGFHCELACKRLETNPILQLVPMNPNYPKIRVPDDTELDIHGIVLHVLHSFKRI